MFHMSLKVCALKTLRRGGHFRISYLLSACINWINKNLPFKDTHKENTISNKNQVFAKSMNMGVWVVGASHQLFIRDSYTKFSKK